MAIGGGEWKEEGVMSWADAAFRFLPIFAVAVLVLLALAQTLFPPWTAAGKRLWLAAIVLCGSLALGATIVDRMQAREVSGPMRELWPRLAESAGWSGPQRPAERAPILRHAIARLNALREEGETLRLKLAALEEKTRVRTIDRARAAKLEAYLARSAGHPVVVTALSRDVEAYQYANQIAHILEKAGWKAEGPEATTVFGSAPAMGINLYPPEKGDAEAAKILASAFAEFNIPYKSRVMPAGIVPQPQVVQLFISRKP
jgi:hypothetical protein